MQFMMGAKVHMVSAPPLQGLETNRPRGQSAISMGLSPNEIFGHQGSGECPLLALLRVLSHVIAGRNKHVCTTAGGGPLGALYLEPPGPCPTWLFFLLFLICILLL